MVPTFGSPSPVTRQMARVAMLAFDAGRTNHMCGAPMGRRPPVGAGVIPVWHSPGTGMASHRPGPWVARAHLRRDEDREGGRTLERAIFGAF